MSNSAKYLYKICYLHNLVTLCIVLDRWASQSNKNSYQIEHEETTEWSKQDCVDFTQM